MNSVSRNRTSVRGGLPCLEVAVQLHPSGADNVSLFRELGEAGKTGLHLGGRWAQGILETSTPQPTPGLFP